MVYKLVPKISDVNKITPDYGKNEILCEIKKDITPQFLYGFLIENLKGYDELEIDCSSFKSLALSNFSDENLELIIGFCTSYVCFVPFSLKSKPSVKKWRVSGLENPKVSNLVDAFEFSRRLQETPANILNTESFVREAREFLSSCQNVNVREISGDDLISEGLNLIEAVGRAFVNPPRLLVIEYKPNPSSDEVCVLVGKGICYDTGGLNIKTGSYMSTMKFDMSGGAVSVGTIYALSKNSSSKNVVVLVPLAENSVSDRSYRPDDVIVSHSGKSVEIDNKFPYPQGHKLHPKKD